jgi:hypothetical protein
MNGTDTATPRTRSARRGLIGDLRKRLGVRDGAWAMVRAMVLVGFSAGLGSMRRAAAKSCSGAKHEQL